MSITRTNPNTIFLGGSRTEVGDLAAATSITPGMLVERDDVGSVIRWKLATADIAGPPAVATEQASVNKGVDDVYATGDLMEVSIGHKGAAFWMLIASGQNIAAGDLLGSAGNGTLKSGATVARFSALETKATVTVTTRIRVEAL
jgi:hypothetical protein